MARIGTSTLGLWTCGLPWAAGCVDKTYGDCLGSNETVEGLVVDTSSDRPVFDWDLGTADALSVYEADGDELGRLMWHVQCGGDNLTDDRLFHEQVCIETPIAYGEAVDSEFLDTVNSTRARPLEPGVAYRLELHTLLEDDGPRPVPDNPVLATMQSWTPDREDAHCGSGFSGEVDFVVE